MNLSQALQKAGYKSKMYLKKNSPTILTYLGVVGIVATGITAATATTKAVKLLEKAKQKKGEELTTFEIVKTTCLTYIPPVIIGASTIACVLGANVLNKRQQASLISAYSLLRSSYTDYTDKVKELYGVDVHEKIEEAIAKDKYNAEYPGLYPTNGLDDVYTDGEKVLFYDKNTKRYFESTVLAVQAAEYHLNRNFVLRGGCSVNEFCEFLGMEPVDGGDCIGWDMSDGFCWIDFHHIKAILDDGLECYIIEADFEPSEEYFEQY